jgi:uncharacterized protein YndB with AHSA1/START domain/rhodanese-related sulfurtransferase
MSRHGDRVGTDASAEPGTVEVSRAVSASPARVWEALTSPEVISRWFGDLTSPLKVGEVTRLEFGDGDFFLLDVTRVEPPVTLQYVWRFLAVAPPDTVTWNVTPGGCGSLVTVTDSEYGRTRDAAVLLRKGWLDFTERLEEFLRNGKPTRYAWRHELDVSVELPAAAEAVWELLLDPQAHPLWLLTDGPALRSGARLVADDGGEPYQFRLQDVELSPPRRLHFKLTHDDWLHPTTFDLELCQRPYSTLLTVSHNGWEAISWEDDYRRRQRMRFCKLWVNGLARLTSEYVRRQEVRSISPSELRDWLKRTDTFAFDCNPRSHWERGHVPGAAHLGEGAFAPQLLPRGEGARLVFYGDESQGLSAYLGAVRARSYGCRHVAVMAGGAEGWAALGFPLAQGRDGLARRDSA